MLEVFCMTVENILKSEPNACIENPYSELSNQILTITFVARRYALGINDHIKLCD